MVENLFRSIFEENSVVSSLSLRDFSVCVIAALIIGLFLAGIYMYRNTYTKSFVLTLALLPAVVCAVIIMVNGNLGTGVAVAGAFSLVRFRSVPGNAKEISFVFLTMAVGLAMGMGYIGYGMLFGIILGVVILLITRSKFGEMKKDYKKKILKVTIAEDLDYTTIFDDIFENYTSTSELIGVKTINMGSMFRLEYEVELLDAMKEREMINELRCRNGNLEISCLRPQILQGEL